MGELPWTLERWSGTAEWVMGLYVRTHEHLHTHQVVVLNICASGCVSAAAQGEMVLSQDVSCRAAKSSSTTKSATDLIFPQMDS